MPALTEFKKSTATQTIVYGPPKSGKSLLAGSLAEYFNLIWIDMENGHEVLYQLPEEWQERITLFNFRDTRSFPIAIESCLKMVRAGSKELPICDIHGKVNCMVCKREEAPTTLWTPAEYNTDNTIVVWDSATQLTNSAISHITKNESDDYKVEWDDWGNQGKLLDIFFSHVQQAPYHNVVISHDVESETEGKKKTLVPVAGTRNFSRNVAKYFGEVVYLERKNKKHVAASSTVYATNILTGSRSNIRLEDMDQPSLLAIYKPDAVGLKKAETNKPTEKVGDDRAKSTLARLQAKHK